jgi:hypothetical protein
MSRLWQSGDKKEPAAGDSAGSFLPPADLLDAMPDAVLVVAPDGRILAANAQCEAVLGYPPAELVGTTVDALVPAALRGRHAGRRQQYVGDPRPRSMGRDLDLQARHRNGQLIPVEISLGPKLAPDGTLEAVIAAVRDVSDRHAAAEALALTNRHLVAIFENAMDTMVITDDGSRVVDINPAGCELVGLSREEILGRDSWEVLGSSPALSNSRWDAFLDAGRLAGAWTIRRHDGEERRAEFTAVADFIPGLHLTVLRDVTERERLEAALRQSQKLDAIGQLAGGIAHDFNNLLTVIVGHSDLLAEQVGSNESVEEIRRAAEHAGALTQKLLAFGRKQALNLELLDLNDVVRDLDGMLRRLIGEEVELAIELEPGLAPVQADRVQLQQVALNLVVNARDAMPQGGLLTVSTANAEEPNPDGTLRRCVRLTVIDTGVGMNAATRERLFEPFFTTKPPGEGTGLGLATVYGIVTQTGGRIEVESASGQGSTFRLCFPAAEGTPERPSAVAPADVAGGTETILLVEDEDAVRALLHRLLSDLGYAVLEARTGREALELAERSGAIHLLLTDTVLPEMSGPELVTRLLEQRPGLRVVHMSGYAEEAVDRFGEFPAWSHYLTKPFTTAQLAIAVRVALDEIASSAPPA